MAIETITKLLYISEEPRKIRTPRVLSDGIGVNHQDRIGRIGINAISLYNPNGTFMEYIRRLRQEIGESLEVLARECRNGRFTGVVAFGDISRLAKIAKNYGFDVFADFVPEDKEVVEFYAQTTGKIAKSQAAFYLALQGIHRNGFQQAPLSEALISRDRLVSTRI